MSVDKRIICDIFRTALSTGGDFAEVFLEDKDELRINCDEGLVTGITTTRIKGCGIYILKNKKSVYVYTNDLSRSALLRTAKRAAEFIGGSKENAPMDLIFNGNEPMNPNKIMIMPSSVSYNQKKDILKDMITYAYSLDSRIAHIQATYFDTDQRIEIFNSLGSYSQDRRISSKVRLHATITDGISYHDDWEDYTRPQGFEAFQTRQDYLDFVAQFIHGLLGNISAVPFESANVPVVFEGGNCGTFWHEACGHQLESYAIVRNSSDFVGMLGKRVASEKVTLVDDGTIPGLYGSAAIDDEGSPTRRNVLIEKGILKGYMIDRLGSRLLNMEPTASGRRQSYTFPPTSRMTNTFLETGEDDEREMISSLEKGVFVKKLGGGTGGREFSIAVKEGFLIEAGKLTKRLKGLVLNGRGIDLIKKVDRVGKVQVTEGGSFCGASSGLCPVTSYQPRMRISNMFVGGK